MGHESDLLLECRGTRFPASAFDRTANAESANSSEAAALRAFLASGGSPGSVGPYGPTLGWRLLTRSATEVTYGRGDPPVLSGYVSLRLVRGTWQPNGFASNCVTRPFRDGMNLCRWGLDPELPLPGEATTAIHVIVNDSQCASGIGPDNRLHEPEIEVTDESVTILFATTPLAGFQTCPGHPAAKRVVKLLEALGSRRLLDGGIFPPQPPCPIEWGNIVQPSLEFGE